MSVFYPLKDIADVHPMHVGEMAKLLYELQQAGQVIPESWVITAAYFQEALQKLTAREPIFADWPQLLWQTLDLQGYAGQHLAQRLCQPLLGLSLNLSQGPLLEAIGTPVVRLLPSLWLGDTDATGDFAEMIGTQVCWAEAGALETAIKRLWAELVGARSIAYCSHRYGARGSRSQAYPQAMSVAIVVQAVEPAMLSGTFTIRSDSVTIQVVQGLSQAIVQSLPDTYHDNLSATVPVSWQPGYQEQSYQPMAARFPLDESQANQLRDCLVITPITTTASEVLSPEAESSLLTTARQIQTWATAPLKVEWTLPASNANDLKITQAFGWPLTQARESAPDHSAKVSHPLSQLSGNPASPGCVVGRALVIHPNNPLPTSAHQQIIVAREVAPHWLPLLKTATAVVSETGGLTCHAAILARELGLPAVVGVTNATQSFQTDDTLQLDGDRGVVEIISTEQAAVSPSSSPPVLFQFEHQTEIWLNLSQPDRAERMASLPVAGIGLLRSEWLMMPVLDHQHPYLWIKKGDGELLQQRLLTQLRPILAAFFPRPVRYRSLDIRSNEFAQLQGAPRVESNPMLGMRGTFGYQQHPEFFQFELALLRQLQSEGYTNLQLLLPFVRTVEEVQYCWQLIQASGIHQANAFELWIMAEVPSVLFLMPQYVAAGVQGIALGTSDLTQLLLGVDRDQALFSTHFDERHPAVQAAIAHLIQQARTLQIPCTLCGVAAAHHTELVKSLVQQGITGISVDAAAIEATARAIGQAEGEWRVEGEE
ncbi:MAG: putative PEP-binding protein [Cyanobacteria bacterium J06626_18]